MKTAKRIVLCTLAMIMLVSLYCVNTYAYGLGSYTENDSNGNDLFNLYLWNDNNQTINYTLHAELTLYGATNYNVGVCYASIQGKLRTTGRIESRDADNINEYYEYTHTFHETDVGYLHNGDYCADSATTSNSDFIALYGQGFVVLGCEDTDDEHDYALVLEELESPWARRRIYFIPQYSLTRTYKWKPVQSDGDSNIQM